MKPPQGNAPKTAQDRLTAPHSHSATEILPPAAKYLPRAPQGWELMSSEPDFHISDFTAKRHRSAPPTATQHLPN